MSTITLHTSALFDPKQKKFLNDMSITVNKETGLIESIYQRDNPFIAAAFWS